MLCFRHSNYVLVEVSRIMKHKVIDRNVKYINQKKNSDLVSYKAYLEASQKYQKNSMICTMHLSILQLYGVVNAI